MTITVKYTDSELVMKALVKLCAIATWSGRVGGGRHSDGEAIGSAICY